MSGSDLVNELRDGGKVPRAPSPGGGIVDLLLAALAVVAIGCAGYFGVNYLLSPHPPQPGSLSPVVETAEAAEPDNAAWTDLDTATCQAKAMTATEAPLPPEFSFANHAVTDGFAGLATRLDCHLSAKVTRFCDPERKKTLVGMVNDYLGRVDMLKLGLGVQGAPMAVMGELLGGEVAMGSGVYQAQKDETLGFMASYHRRIANDLQAMARDGIVTPEDFGAFLGMGVPPAISEMFGGVVAVRRVCS